MTRHEGHTQNAENPERKSRTIAGASKDLIALSKSPGQQSGLPSLPLRTKTADPQPTPQLNPSLTPQLTPLTAKLVNQISSELTAELQIQQGGLIPQ